MEDFLFHNLSDKEREEVKKESKKMLDSFSEKISRVGVFEREPVVKREESEREEKGGEESESGFREIMFENAPKKNKDFIIAEKKKW